MRLRLHPDAASEIQQEAAYYEDIAPGLGIAFLDEIDAAIDRACQAPEAFPRRQANLRIAILSRFPFSVLYRFENDVLEVLVVRHHARRGDYGMDRL